MTPEAQRIAIAEACGWKWYYDFNTSPQRYTFTLKEEKTMGSGYALLDKNPKTNNVRIDGAIPNYLTDLNAMHEALDVFDGKQWNCFAKNLEMIVRRDERLKVWRSINPSMLIDALLAYAEADQMAEAFLRTLGKWESSP